MNAAKKQIDFIRRIILLDSGVNVKEATAWIPIHVLLC